MSDDAGSWKAVTLAEMKRIIEEELCQCTPEDFALFDKIRIEPEKIPFDRGSFVEEVFVVARQGEKLVFFDDIEDGFEVATTDDDGVIRRAGVGHFDLCHALAHIRLGWR